jgi:bifunctional DNase/RNase
VCQLEFVDVVMVLPSTHPVVVLQELSWPRRELRIPVGVPEGVAIAYAARAIPTPKPLTHQLMAEMLEAFALSLDVLRLTAVQGSAFFAELVLSGPSGTRVIACRPSDGIALVLRSRLAVPIVAASEVLDEVGTPVERDLTPEIADDPR